jgi:hypothetical protein
MNNEYKEFECTVTVVWEGNNHEVFSKEEYIRRVKESFYESYQLELHDSEITDIKEIINE